MDRRAVEVVIERTFRARDAIHGAASSCYGVGRLVGNGYNGSGLEDGIYVLAKLDDPLQLQVVLQKSECLSVPRDLGIEAALAAPPLALALWIWDRLHLELGEAAIYTDGDFFSDLSDLVGQVALWRGGCPVIKVCGDAEEILPAGGRSLTTTDPDGTLQRLLHWIKDKPGVGAVDLSGRPEMIDLLLEVMPRWGRLMIAGRTCQRLTVDFYNNVHRKGVILSSMVFDPTFVFQGRWGVAHLAAAFRILQNKEMAAVCLRLTRIQPSVRP
jgi:hypothetical protein